MNGLMKSALMNERIFINFGTLFCVIRQILTEHSIFHPEIHLIKRNDKPGQGLSVGKELNYVQLPKRTLSNFGQP
jgi:hypothetical protein